MDPKASTSLSPPPAKSRRRAVPTTFDALGNDVLCMIFAFLDVVQLIRCATVCKSWNIVINKLKLVQIQYQKQTDSVSLSDVSSFSEKSINIEMERLAMEQQRLSLQEGSVDIFQWKGHSVG
ncbi:UNVERIFIED_CONTAM: F-box/WD-40 repeat-containing protein [Sesamum radiatum]|uniref:F-box/WD-40 repeat-containing protein n=1 Tax=Sesamum radiatum TaxID=300843 RepID=A0AAW2S646_SESRA